MLGAVLAAPVGVALLVLCVSFFRAARGLFTDQQSAQRVIVVVVTLLGSALALGLLALAAARFVGRAETRAAEPGRAES